MKNYKKKFQWLTSDFLSIHMANYQVIQPCLSPSRSIKTHRDMDIKKPSTYKYSWHWLPWFLCWCHLYVAPIPGLECSLFCYALPCIGGILDPACHCWALWQSNVSARLAAAIRVMLPVSAPCSAGAMLLIQDWRGRAVAELHWHWHCWYKTSRAPFCGFMQGVVLGIAPSLTG